MDAISDEIMRQRPQLVGISQWTHNRHASIELARLVRRLLPTALIVFGGAHASFTPTDALTDDSPVDCIVIGEGELTVLELSERLCSGHDWRDVRGIAYLGTEGGIVTTPQRPLIADLDRLPQASRYLDHSTGVDLQLQPEFIITARGCPSDCGFCSSPRLWGRTVRFRSPEHIVDEMEYIRQQYGLIYFSLRDDTFTADRRRTIDFCRLLIDRRLFVLWNCQSRVTSLNEEVLAWMKRAGCECIQLGVESGSERLLKQLGKKITPDQVTHCAAMIRRIGINLSIYLISDVPGETEEDVKATLSLVRRIKPDDGYVSPLAYFPGTRLYDEALEQGLVAPDAFMKSDGDALYVASNRSGAAMRMLRTVSSSHPGKPNFSDQKRILGYCYSTSVLAGEYCRMQGDFAGAEKEFLEITVTDPDNPWGWYLLAELYRELGRRERAKECYRRVIALVPKHLPSQQALKETKKRG